MHFNATAGSYQWPVGRSTIRIAIHCEGRHEFCVLQVSALVAARIPDNDRSGKDFFALSKLLEF